MHKPHKPCFTYAFYLVWDSIEAHYKEIKNNRAVVRSWLSNGGSSKLFNIKPVDMPWLSALLTATMAIGHVDGRSHVPNVKIIYRSGIWHYAFTSLLGFPPFLLDALFCHNVKKIMFIPHLQVPG